MKSESGATPPPDELCECICNHSGACTGCGVCWLKAYYEPLDQRIVSMFALPWLQLE